MINDDGYHVFRKCNDEEKGRCPFSFKGDLTIPNCRLDNTNVTSDGCTPKETIMNFTKEVNND
jgi:hypothetical protein